MQPSTKTLLFVFIVSLSIACKKDYAKKMTGIYKGSTKYFLRDSLSAIKDSILSESKITIEKTKALNIVKLTITNPGMPEFVYREVIVEGDRLKYIPAPQGSFSPSKIEGSLIDNLLSLVVEHRTTGPYTWTMDIKALK